MTGYISIRLIFVALLLGIGNAQNNSSSCSNLTSIVTDAVTSAVASDPRMGASLLRLHFHDCFVNGCDGSVLLNDTANFTGEKNAGPNVNSLRGFEVIDTIKSRVEAVCPGIVSCADILALAAREGVVALSGPSWNVTLGRMDSRTASQNDANTQIPGPGLNLTALLSSFSNKGFTQLNELVALSGAHTIGRARCTTFRARLYGDSNINAAFANATRQSCPSAGSDNSLSPLDSTPATFDNDYYTNLMSLSGLLHSDQELFNNGSADAQVRLYASNSVQFRRDFASAMVKMSNLGPSSGAAAGEIRRNCWSINS